MSKKYHLQLSIYWLFLIIIFGATNICLCNEYEVKGSIRQSIIDFDSPRFEYTNEFTVYVRDCDWLIQTTERQAGHVCVREVGATNDTEIYESTGMIKSKGIPVELLDRGVVGHLWLMFASQCYWKNL
jgi:hypothetical protein